MKREKDLKELRSQIREVDEKLLVLLAERQTLAKQVGEIKFTQGLPIKDDSFEKNILENTKRRAKDLGLHEEMAEEILKTLIQYSCQIQEENYGQAKPCK